MTVRQFLNPTSGLCGYTESDDFWSAVQERPTRIWAPADLVAIAAKQEPYFEPGQAVRRKHTPTNP